MSRSEEVQSESDNLPYKSLAGKERREMRQQLKGQWCSEDFGFVIIHVFGHLQNK